MAVFGSVVIVIIVVFFMALRASRRLSLGPGLRKRQLPNRGPRRATRDQRTIVWSKSGGRCAHCGQKCIRSYDVVSNRGEVDHIVPWSWGGQTTLSNLQLLCHTCNTRKSNHYAG
jgi:5-methylcytosine-specific restriction endonuclease McrA